MENNMKLEIEKTLVISTGHISLEDNEKLAFASRGYDTESFIVHPHDNGFKIQVNLFFSEDLEQMYAGFSSGFVKCMMFAFINDCTCINFDSDGPSFDFLPKYEW